MCVALTGFLIASIVYFTISHNFFRFRTNFEGIFQIFCICVFD